jgi:hypothetical protein
MQALRRVEEMQPACQVVTMAATISSPMGARSHGHTTTDEAFGALRVYGYSGTEIIRYLEPRHVSWADPLLSGGHAAMGKGVFETTAASYVV